MLTNLSATWKAIVERQLPANTVLELFGPAASRVYNPSFSSMAAESDVVLISGLGHGSATMFTDWRGGSLYPPIPMQEVAGRVVHLTSCSTADRLGQSFIQARCRAFIGYKGVIDIDVQEDWIYQFIQCDAQIDLDLYSGKSVRVAVDNARAAFRLAKLPDPAKQLTIYGDETAVVPASSANLRSAVLPVASTPVHELPPAALVPGQRVAFVS